MTTSQPSPATRETGERELLGQLAAFVRLLREDFAAVYSPVAALNLTQTADSLLADYDCVADTTNSVERERDALKIALAAYVKFSDEAAKLLDADNDARCLKLLLAMSGHAPRYRRDVDEARAALGDKQ